MKNRKPQYIKSNAIEDQQPKVFDLMERMLNEIIIFSKKDYQLLYANTGALNCLGLNPNELDGKKMYELLADYDEALIRKATSPLIKGRKAKLYFTVNL